MGKNNLRPAKPADSAWLVNSHIELYQHEYGFDVKWSGKFGQRAKVYPT